MITPVVPTLPRKITARSPMVSPRSEVDPRERQHAVAFSDGAAVLTLADGEALVVDVRAGLTPSEHVQHKLMRLLQDRSLPPRR